MKAVAYYRVSTQKQGHSGLGLEAQQRAVEAFCQQRGYTLLDSYTEIESGKLNKRPQLEEAMRRAVLTNSMLLVAKLDRLSRNVAFLATLMEGHVKFIAVDMPDANALTLHVLAAVAQAERKSISERTKAALAAAKARGTKLGNPNGAAAFRRAGSKNRSGPEARRAQSQAYAERLRSLLTPMRGMKLQDIADALNSAEVATPKGGRWYASSVRNVLQRLS